MRARASRASRRRERLARGAHMHTVLGLDWAFACVVALGPRAGQRNISLVGQAADPDPDRFLLEISSLAAVQIAEAKTAMLAAHR